MGDMPDLCRSNIRQLLNIRCWVKRHSRRRRALRCLHIGIPGAFTECALIYCIQLYTVYAIKHLHAFFHTFKNSIAYMQYPYIPMLHSHTFKNSTAYMQYSEYAVPPPRMHGCMLICAHCKEIRKACAAMRLGWLSARARAQLTEILGCGGTMLRPVKSLAYTVVCNTIAQYMQYSTLRH